MSDLPARGAVLLPLACILVAAGLGVLFVRRRNLAALLLMLSAAAFLTGGAWHFAAVWFAAGVAALIWPRRRPLPEPLPTEQSDE